jgi:hypothetical protein
MGVVIDTDRGREAASLLSKAFFEQRVAGEEALLPAIAGRRTGIFGPLPHQNIISPPLLPESATAASGRSGHRILLSERLPSPPCNRSRN